MSLLFDQNLSRRLPALLAAEFPGSQQVLLVGMDQDDDLTIWAYALAQSLTIVSKDTDFRDISLAKGAPPKTIWLRVGNCSTRTIVSLFQSRCRDIRTFLSNQASTLLELP